MGPGRRLRGRPAGIAHRRRVIRPSTRASHLVVRSTNCSTNAASWPAVAVPWLCRWWYERIGSSVGIAGPLRQNAFTPLQPIWCSTTGWTPSTPTRWPSGCTVRGQTVYRHTGGKAQIRDAVLLRIAAGITDTVRREVASLSGPERVVKAIAVALQQIRSEPIRQPMMNSSKAPELSDLHSSPVLGAPAAELTGSPTTTPQRRCGSSMSCCRSPTYPLAMNRLRPRFCDGSSLPRSTDNRRQNGGAASSHDRKSALLGQ